MNDISTLSAPAAFASLPSEALASVLDQSADCVKLLGLDGSVQYMNRNGLCAMEIDDFCSIEGKPWASLWLDGAHQVLMQSLADADSDGASRFKAFCPTAKGDPRWWDVSISAVAGADGTQVGYLAVSRDVTESEVSREALEIAAAELKHRLANTYSMISGLLAGFAHGNPNNERFAEDMRNRLSALGRAQSLFVTKEAPCAIAALVPVLLEPFDRPSCPIVIGTLASTCVDQGQADAIALTMGELAVNSSKHGALAHGGEIHVSSTGEPESTTIRWAERCDRPLPPRASEGGQGLRLMDRIVRARRGSIDFAWHDTGLNVTLTFRNG